MKKFLFSCLDQIYFRVRGKRFSGYVAENIITISRQLIVRYFPKFLRGIWFLLITDSNFPSFVGKNLCIYSADKLHAGSNLLIGDFCFFNLYSTKGVYFGSNVTIREFGWIQLTSSFDNPGSYIEIGDSTYIGPRSYIGAGGSIVIGKNCQLGANVSLIGESHLYSNQEAIYKQSTSRRGITIGDDCWFGNNVVVLDGVSIGNGCVVGASAVVTKSLPDNSVAVGVPARVISNRKK